MEKLLSEEEENRLIITLQSFGAQVSWCALDKNTRKPHEINTALYDALKGTTEEQDSHNLKCFICAHTIVFGLQGVPAFYIHSLLATGNDEQTI